MTSATRWFTAALALGATASAFTPAASAQTVEDIVVTARKRDELAQTVPLAVTVVSAAQLENEGAVTIEDIQGLAPNVVIDTVSAGPGGSAVAIRGISFEDIERSFEPTVGLVIDGVFLGTNSAQLSNTFDFETVEVLRGPQGTLFGRNTIGGVINIRRTKPTKDFGFRAQATVAEFDRQEYSAILNVPIGDRIGLKGFVFNREFGGFLDNVTTGARDGRNDYFNAGVTGLIDVTNNLEALITVEWQEFQGDPAVVPLSNGSDLICSGIPGVLPPFAPPNECSQSVDSFAESRKSFSNFEDEFDLNEFDVTGELNWSLGDFTVTSISAFRTSDEIQTQDFDGSSAEFFSTQRVQTYEQFSQELRLAGSLTKYVDFVTGFYLFASNYTLEQATDSPLFFSLDLLSPGQLLASVEQDTLSFAFFSDIDFNITERLRLNLGGRFTRDQKDFRISNTLLLTAPGLAIPLFDTTDPAQVPAGVRQGADGFLEAEFSDFAPRVSLDYRFTDDFLGYLSWSQGFRAGGFNGRAGSIVAATTIFEPEEVNSFEAGFKSEWFDNRFRFNATFFAALYDDRQEDTVLATDTPPFQETVVLNASDSTFFGLEIDSKIVLSDHFDIVWSFGWLDASFDSFPVVSADPVTGETITFDQSDLEIRRAPDFTYSITANYNRELGPGDFNASLSWRFTDALQTTIVNANPLIGPQIDPPLAGPNPNGLAFNDPRGVSEPEGILNLTLGYGFDVKGSRWNVSVFGRNLLNDVGLGSALPVAGLFTFGTLDTPRNFGGSVAVEF